MPRGKKWLRKSEQGDKWNRCLIEGMIVPSECWQSAQVGQIRTREDYYYEELRGSSLRVLL